MKSVIAVLDIGKTNKKVALFDMALGMVDTRRRKIEPVQEDGLSVEDVEQIEEWFLDELRTYSRSYDIRAISIATHGAAAVCVGTDGKPSVPPVDYTQSVDESLRERFFGEMGTPEELQKTTATAEVQPLINVGKLLFFLKERYPRRFPATEHVLLYPQYFAYRLTGKASADITYVGCHTYLWDHNRDDWSRVVDRLGIRKMLPERLVAPTEVLGTITPEVARRTGLAPDVVVTAGIHDSNSSLIPYLITRDHDFVLNSTGTWCVAMHPSEEVSFGKDEIGKMVFFNTSYAGQPIKTSILMGGLEYETYQMILSKLHGRTDEPPLNVSLLQEIVNEATTFVLPSVVKGAGQFPDSEGRVVEYSGPSRDSSDGGALADARRGANARASSGADADTEADGGPDTIPRVGGREPEIVSLATMQAGEGYPDSFRAYERGLALVDLSVAIQSVIALRRVGMQAGTDVFIEGGFRNNETYLAFLAALLPDNPIYRTSVEEATAFGAALCGKAAIENRPVEELSRAVRLELSPVPTVEIPGVRAYMSTFLEMLGQE